jgi:hypothetical protein
MSKVVAGISPKKHYTPVSNSLIRNSEIDDGTFRLICWMTSHVEGFEINFISIQRALGYGRDKLRKLLKTAESQNYLVRRKIRTEAGLFDFEYHIFKDTEDAIAFRESLPQEELTSDVFSGGGSTRGVLSGGGSSGGGSTGGGESDPHKEEEYREDQIKEEKREENSPTPQTEFVEFKPEPIKQDPTPQRLSSLSNQTGSSPQTDNPDLDTKVPAKFDKLEQPNLASLSEQRKYNAAQKCDEFFTPKRLPPWRISAKDFDSEFVEHWRIMLAKSSEWRDRGIEPMAGDAKRSLKRMEKFDLGSVEDLWEAYLERKQVRILKEQTRAQLEPEAQQESTPQQETPAPPPVLPPELRKKLDAARLKSLDEQQRRLSKIKLEARRTS